MLTHKEWLDWVTEYNKTHHDGPRTMDEVGELHRKAQEETTVKEIIEFITGIELPECKHIVNGIKQKYGVKL